jgi:nucleotide-binding universal stress UspA family protein
VYDRILFPTDGSEGAAAALDHVLDVASARDATVHLLTVVDTSREGFTWIQEDVVDALEDEGERIVDEAAERADERGVRTVTAVHRGEPHRGIVDYARDQEIDLIVMPTRGRTGLERLLLGSTTERVVRFADTPVLTLQPDADVDYPYRTVLVPTDGSDCADAALSTGVDVATREGAALHVLSVVDVRSLGVDVRSDIQTTMLEDAAEGIVDRAAERAEDAGVDPVARVTEYGSSIHEAIRSYVGANDVDLVVVGTHGRTGFDRYLLGSVTEALLRTSPVPVLSVRPPDAE